MFAHALLQRACYELMLPSARGELHRRALEYLDVHKLAPPEELAAHALAGLAGAPPGIGAQLKVMRREYLEKAADAALAGYANERGLGHLAELLACEGLTETKRLELQLKSADVLNRVGRMDEAVAAAEAGLRVAHSLKSGLEVARAQFVLGRCCLDTASNARAFSLLSEAVAALRAHDERPTLERALSALSRALFNAGRPAEALASAHEAVALARALGDETRMVRGNMHLMSVLAQLSHNEEALALAGQLAPILDTSPSPEIRCALAASLASLRHGLGQLEESGHFHERASREAILAGLQAEVARAAVNLGGIALQLRRFHQGLIHVERAESMARELGNVRVLWFALRNRCDIFDAVGDHRSALQAATSAARVAESASMAWHFLVSCAQAAAAFLELGQPDDALDWVDAALRAPRAGQFLNFVLAKLSAQRACALYRQQRRVEAAQALEQMERFLKLAGSEPDEDSQRWIQEARAHASA